jgi:diguanylate cyclase (GGDEF)-like protein
VNIQESAGTEGGRPDPQKLDGSQLQRIDLLESSGALDHLDELRRESRELDSLINDAAGLFALTEIEAMLSFVISRLLDRFIPTRFVFLIQLPDGDGVNYYSYRNLKPDSTPFPVQYYRLFSEFFRKMPYAAPFSALEERFGADHFGDDLRAFEPDMLFPMIGIGGIFGVVVLGSKMVGGDYSNLERMYTDRFIRFLAISIQNRLHQERSITDLKTGLYNHAFFIKRLEEEMARVVRGHSHAALIMLDIDHFKVFNDTWGHLAGDEVLVALSRVLKHAIRSEDVAARYGGEEFCILLVECEEEKIVEVCERIRKEIASMAVPYRGQNLAVTASFGCCTLDPACRSNPEAIIDRADSALYRSKARGRNRTSLYRPGLLGRASACLELSSPS